MNLHQTVSGAISAVNPFQPVTVQLSTGYRTAPNGKRTPTYNPPVTVSGQVQELTTRDLRQLEGLNQQGSMRAIYLNGSVDAIVRLNQEGGDLITLQDNSVWLTTQVLERWDVGWCKVSVTLQIDKPNAQC